MCFFHVAIVFVISSILLTDHVSETLVPKCPSMWRLLDGQCYRLTTPATSHTGAAAKCKKLHASAHLTEISTEEKRKTVSAFLGIINRLTVFWVKTCASDLVTLGAADPCRALANWPPPYNVADFICYGKPCQGGGRRAVCEMVADDMDQCAQNTCQNGATCVDEYQNYRCECKGGYTGRHCETDIDECASNPCMHSGTCVDGVTMFTCNCPPGYIGTNCEKDLPTLHLDTNTSDRGERYINVKISSCSTRGTQITGAKLLKITILVQRYNSSESLIQYGTCEDRNLNISILEPNRRYRITLQPVFQYNGDSYNGKSVLLEESVKTACEAPDQPVIIDFTRTRRFNAAIVFWQFSGNHNCDSFKNCKVITRKDGQQDTTQDKVIDCEHRHFFIYQIETNLQYVLQIRLSNNEGKWAQSMDYVIPPVKGDNTGSSSTNVTGISAGLFGGASILFLAAFIVLVVIMTRMRLGKSGKCMGKLSEPMDSSAQKISAESDGMYQNADVLDEVNTTVSMATINPDSPNDYERIQTTDRDIADTRADYQNVPARTQRVNVDHTYNTLCKSDESEAVTSFSQSQLPESSPYEEIKTANK